MDNRSNPDHPHYDPVGVAREQLDVPENWGTYKLDAPIYKTGGNTRLPVFGCGNRVTHPGDVCVDQAVWVQAFGRWRIARVTKLGPKRITVDFVSNEAGAVRTASINGGLDHVYAAVR